MNTYTKDILRASDSIGAILTRVTGIDLAALNSEQIIERANALKDGVIPFMTLSEYRAFAELGDGTEFEKKYRERRERMLLLILAEAISSKGEYTDALTDAMWAISEETSWILPRNTSVSPTAAGTDVPEVIDGTALHGIDESALGTAILFAAISHAGLTEKLFEISDILPERIDWELTARCVTPFLNLGYSCGVNPEQNDALLYVAEAVGATDSVSRKIKISK